MASTTLTPPLTFPTDEGWVDPECDWASWKTIHSETDSFSALEASALKEKTVNNPCDYISTFSMCMCVCV